MADPTAFYEPEDDELLSSLAIPSFQGDQASYEDEYRRMQELEQHAYAQQAELEHNQLLELVPEDVKRVRASPAADSDALVFDPLPPGYPRERPSHHYDDVRVWMEQAHQCKPLLEDFGS
jgi:hypothetical protein